ncbi:hypothetical protein PV08_11654 [Exophiala spinifera]|uniref:Transcription factor domain-containing protein n=1 Tax=Exophiala spinifera TaxID=91928 RepID=A0A0D2AW39_9EURO|nr:uncharacterized protein PV08_11654 [Exophiala spinifera]KIW10690.1 hypothetical protein PV08_11654 [Exophiala spinifera]
MPARSMPVPTTLLLLERIVALEDRLDSESSQLCTSNSPHERFNKYRSSSRHARSPEAGLGNYPATTATTATSSTSTGLSPEDAGSAPPDLLAISAEVHPIVSSNAFELVKASAYRLDMTGSALNVDCRMMESPAVNGQAYFDAELDQTSAILPLVTIFLNVVCPLFPIICDQKLHETTAAVLAQGLRNDLPSCMIILVVSLAKLYSQTNMQVPDLLADFETAAKLLSALPMHLTLEYAQSQVLCALFLLKRHQVLDAWKWLHAGCSTLYSLIKRQEKMSRPQDERNTIRRMFWVIFNLERDITCEIDTLPPSRLAELESYMPLPLGCDESSLSHLKAHTRLIYMFFLAETSLKLILFRTKSLWTHTSRGREAEPAILANSPVVLELKKQLDVWEDNLPVSLDWKREATKGGEPQLAIRLRLTFWLARFYLFEPVILHVLDNVGSQFSLDVWTSFTHGLSAGTTLVRELLKERLGIDCITGKRQVQASHL